MKPVMLFQNADIITSWLKCSTVHRSWHAHLKTAFAKMDPDYLAMLDTLDTWLPGKERFLNAFSLPLPSVKYVLMGESPYPRAVSANGYAFWDANVKTLWSETGLNKAVNRATSLRHLIKMLLCAEGLLKEPTQSAIASLKKSHLIATLDELFNKLLGSGFLLLNATLALTEERVARDAAAWRPFLKHIFTVITQQSLPPTVILFGKIAEICSEWLHKCPVLIAEHPYNVSFVTNEEVRAFFQPFHLLRA